MVDFICLMMIKDRRYGTHGLVLYSHQGMTWVRYPVNWHAMFADLGLVSLLHYLFNQDLVNY
jgi:hypothetical protein